MRFPRPELLGRYAFIIARRPQGKDLKFLVATLEQDEAAVVQVSLNPGRLSQAIDEWTTKPDETAESVRVEAGESESERLGSLRTPAFSPQR